MSDGATDKYIHLSLLDPEPDGIVREFAAPDTHIVAGSMTVSLDGEDITPPEYDPEADPAQDEYILLGSGGVVIAAPDTGAKLRASYYFQWFTDAELAQFLGQATGLLGYFNGVVDDSLSVQIRTPLISFAAHYAYLKMAAASAQALIAGAAGYEADNSKEHPNWMALAEMAWATALKELEIINTNPISATRPQMRFVSFRLQRYVPRS